ncbi:MAG: hypothetical protein EU533_05730 [Promethearchaeota archaeon]|nr:MAG: hypothetical protein EU533_05730 [Candidatus Lokiarchaeota archaeon]
MSDGLKSHIFEGKILEYKNELMNFFIEVNTSRGQTLTLCKIIGNLLIHGNLTQKQLKKLTNLSTGSISTNFSALASIGVVEKKRILGTHTYEYSINIDLTSSFASSFRMGLQYLNQASNFLESKKRELEDRFESFSEEFQLFSNIMQDFSNVIRLYLKIYEIFINSSLEMSDLNPFINHHTELDHFDKLSAKFIGFESEFLDFFMATPIFLGKREIFSKTLGYFITRRHLTQSDLKELTGLSAGKISQDINRLLDIGVIKVSEISKTGEITYERKSITASFFTISRNILSIYSKWKKRLEEIASELRNGEKELKKLNGYENIVRMLRMYLDLMPHFEKMREAVDYVLNKS